MFAGSDEQDAEHRATCQRRDEDGAEEADPELEELYAFFDQPSAFLPSPQEETLATERLRRRMARLAAAGVEYDARDWE